MDDSTLISEDDARIIYGELSNIPFVDPLVRTFKREANPLTLRHKFGSTYYGDNHKDNQIYAETKDYSDLGIVLILKQVHQEGALLDFYFGNIKQILQDDRSDFFYKNFATIWAMPKKTGYWFYGSGDQMIHAITIRMKEINLPSKTGRWFFDLMSWFALISSEQLSISEQPTFWTGDKETPDD